ncbi:MAG TPA: hypothetical protein VNZ45_10635, partial [Bacteroidia bacterium]|nr:hypothetical protein [Bacteroidia bacterium]
NGAIITLFLWNLHRTRVINRNASNDTTITTRGDTIVNGINYISSWGQTRFSQNYYTSVTTPIFQDVSGSTYYNPLSGVKSVQGISEPLVITYGVDQSGTPVVSNPFGYKMMWTNTNGAQNSVISY